MYIQSKHHPTQPRTKHHLNRPPLLPRQHIQITRKRDPRQQIREKHIDRTGKDELVENLPVRYIALGKVFDVLTQEAEGMEGVGEFHLCSVLAQEGSEMGFWQIKQWELLK